MGNICSGPKVLGGIAVSLAALPTGETAQIIWFHRQFQLSLSSRGISAPSIEIRVGKLPTRNSRYFLHSNRMDSGFRNPLACAQCDHPLTRGGWENEQ